MNNLVAIYGNLVVNRKSSKSWRRKATDLKPKRFSWTFGHLTAGLPH